MTTRRLLSGGGVGLRSLTASIALPRAIVALPLLGSWIASLPVAAAEVGEATLPGSAAGALRVATEAPAEVGASGAFQIEPVSSRERSAIDEFCPPHAPCTASRAATAEESLDGLAGDLWGVRRAIADAGIDIAAELTLDSAWNTRGGTRTGFVFMGLLDLSLSVRTEPLVHWEGGRFSIAMLSYWQSRDPFGLVDDWWGWDAIASGIGSVTQISELWYEQELLDRFLTIRFGKQDANSTFAVVPGAGAFVASAATYPGTMVEYLPTYPRQAVGLDLAVRPTEWLTGRFGWFDGTTSYYDSDRGSDWPNTGTRGPSSFFSNPGSWFLITEIDGTWSLGDRPHPGRVQVGYWWQTGTIGFENDPTYTVKGSEGFHAGLSQTLFNLADDEVASRRIELFTQIGTGQARSNPSVFSLIAGSTLIGVLPGRERDQCGVQFNYLKFTRDDRVWPNPGGEQYAVELFYRVQLTPVLAFQPDLQWIRNAGGDRSLSDALLLTLRVHMAF